MFLRSKKIDAKLLDLYLKSLSAFGKYRGESFLQFSPYITTDKKRYLFELLQVLPKGFEFSIELRHESWFSDEVTMKKLCEYLSSKNIGLIVTDTPGRRDVLHMNCTTDRAFVRFKGNNLDPTDFKRMEAWCEFLKSEPAFKKIYFFHHHSNEKNCIDTIKYMTDRMDGSFSNFVPNIDLFPDQLDLL